MRQHQSSDSSSLRRVVRPRAPLPLPHPAYRKMKDIEKRSPSDFAAIEVLADMVIERLNATERVRRLG